jgi:kinase
MIDTKVLASGFMAISKKISENKMYLISLDQKIGDGDLGISMDNGFKAASDIISVNADAADIGKLLFLAGKGFNEAAPSSLGTIISMLLIDAAKEMKGREETSLADFGKTIHKSINTIMEKLESKLGEKTFFDAVLPAAEALCEDAELSDKQRLKNAAEAACNGAESTKDMVAKHGRAAYFAEKTLGSIDGGAEVGRIIFETIADQF